MVASMEERTAAILDHHVDAITAKARGGEVVDLVEELAVPLPLTVIAEMLGVSPADRDEFHSLVARFADLPTSGLGQLKAIPLGRRLLRIFDRLVDQARRAPDAGLVRALVRAQDEAGDRLRAAADRNSTV